MFMESGTAWLAYMIQSDSTNTVANPITIPFGVMPKSFPACKTAGAYCWAVIADPTCCVAAPTAQPSPPEHAETTESTVSGQRTGPPTTPSPPESTHRSEGSRGGPQDDSDKPDT